MLLLPTEREIEPELLPDVTVTPFTFTEACDSLTVGFTVIELVELGTAPE